MLAELQVDMETAKVDENEDGGRGVRTSRRIAQIRLKVTYLVELNSISG